LNTKKNILIICNTTFISGAELNLFQFLKYYDKKKYEIVLILPDKNIDFIDELIQCTVLRMPFIWFVRSFNPFYLIKCLINIIYCSFRIRKIIRDKKINIIYSNSVKSHIYGSLLKIITGKKVIWHVRDNIRNGPLDDFLITFSDKIICISDHVYQQIKTSKKNKELIYGGIDYNEWSPLNHTKNNDLKISLGLTSEVKLVAQIGQLTSWKNNIDFIKAAAEIIQNYPINVHFLIVGDDLSGQEQIYKKQLNTEILKAGLEKHISFLGFIRDVKAIYAQIDILVHTAIDEPFGRVFVEAMAMEKPVVAYACGGPKEIIVNNQTGYLVKPYDFKAIGEKVILLLKNEKLHITLGTEGRKRVIEKFNINDNICKIETLFDNM